MNAYDFERSETLWAFIRGGPMTKNDLNSYKAFYDQMIASLRANLPSPILARKPEFRVKSNRLQIFLDGIRGSHYEMCFRRDYHEFALHFESTPGRSLARRQAFDPHLQELS